MGFLAGGGNYFTGCLLALCIYYQYGPGYDFFGIWPEPTLYWPAVLYAIALIYQFTKGFRQWRILHYLHMVSLLLFPIVIFNWALAWGNMPEETYYYIDGDNSQTGETFRMIKESLILPAAIFILVAQVGFIVNIVAGFIRGKKALPRYNNAFAPRCPFFCNLRPYA